MHDGKNTLSLFNHFKAIINEDHYKDFSLLIASTTKMASPTALGSRWHTNNISSCRMFTVYCKVLMKRGEQPLSSNSLGMVAPLLMQLNLYSQVAWWPSGKIPLVQLPHMITVLLNPYHSYESSLPPCLSHSDLLGKDVE